MHRHISLVLVMFTLLLGAFAMSQPPSQHHLAPGIDTLYSTKELGCIAGADTTIFRLFAPRATHVTLVLFAKHDDTTGTEHAMARDGDGVWECGVTGALFGTYYGYRVDGPKGKGEMFNPHVVIADPYSKAVVTKNTWRHPAKTLILDTRYDWQGDTFVAPADHNRLLIYEAHVRDLTAHRFSGVEKKGTYLGLTEEGKTGGMSYLTDLGINAIELLPVHKFGNIELPYRDTSVIAEGYPVNTWNPYARNHWGYMTSYFFAPETYYATDGTMEPGAYNGTDGRAVREFKDMVKSFHRKGTAVILDVVFNHVSQYDYNPFKYIDKFYYFHCDAAGNFLGASGCGNDFKTERRMARRMIVDCVKYWMEEYHIDGFRFDLATMIDWETCQEITREARKINPNVVLIAEAWGGGKYDPAGFSSIGWAAWNDQIRNGVKGQNPHDGLGFIFGKFQGGNTKKSLTSYITGTLREDSGMFVRKEHSINYLESHDDATMGDFIRIGSGEVKESLVVRDLLKHTKLTPKQMALNKLAALYLMTSQGPVMIHEGQEYARSKVIAPTTAPDPGVGRIDHNSYNKDNETNYLNYRQQAANKSLYDYYKGLIALRKQYPAFGSSPKEAVEFIETENNFLIAYRLKDAEGGKSFVVILNGDPKRGGQIPLPAGTWSILVDRKEVKLDGTLGSITRRITVPPTSGVVLREE